MLPFSFHSSAYWEKTEIYVSLLWNKSPVAQKTTALSKSLTTHILRMWGGWLHVWWELWFQCLLPPLIYLDSNSVKSQILCTSSCTYTCDIQRYLFYLIDQKAGTQSRKRGVSIITELPALPLVSQGPWALTIYTWVYTHESPDLLGKEAVC